MSPRTQTALSWAGLIVAVLGFGVAMTAGAVQFGRRDAVIDTKVSEIQYQQDLTRLAEKLGEIRADVAAIKTILEERTQRARQQGGAK